jgi:two-component system, chemotaxis family, chemotaxis protein CheY
VIRGGGSNTAIRPHSSSVIRIGQNRPVINNADVGARIFVVDDHVGFRESVRRLLEMEGYMVVGEAADGRSALLRMPKLEPEIALVDLHLPDIDGVELASRLRELVHPPSVILTSSHDGTDLLPFIATSGASGFVPKAELSREAIERLLQ